MTKSPYAQLGARLVDNGYAAAPEYYCGNVRISDCSHSKGVDGLHLNLKITPVHFEFPLDFNVVLKKEPDDDDIRLRAFSDIQDAVGAVEINEDSDLVGKEFYSEALFVDEYRFGPIYVQPPKTSDVYPRMPARPPNGQCGLYIIECVSSDPPICKIGITSNPESRLYQIANTSPFKVQYKYFMCLPSRDEALANEAKLHSLFSDERMNGEWFSIPSSAAVYALASVAW